MALEESGTHESSRLTTPAGTEPDGQQESSSQTMPITSNPPADPPADPPAGPQVETTPISSNDALVQLLREQQALTRAMIEQQELSRTAFEQRSEEKTKKYKMVDPKPFCGGAAELDDFISSVEKNFDTHAHLFPDEKTKVSYALDLLGKWAEHPDPSKRTTRGTDPITWARDMRLAKHECLQSFETFVTEITREFGDKDRRAKAVDKAYKECLQGYHNSNETVREYSMRIRALWREAGWPADCLMAYDLARYGLRPQIQSRIKQFASKEPNGRFTSVTELFDHAADAEFPARPSEPKKAMESTGGDSKSGRKRQSISTDSRDHEKISTSSSSSATKTSLPPAPIVSKEVYDARKAKNHCLRCGYDHLTFKCPIYSKANLPSLSSSTDNPPKRSKTVDTSRKDKNDRERAKN